MKPKFEALYHQRTMKPGVTTSVTSRRLKLEKLTTRIEPSIERNVRQRVKEKKKKRQKIKRKKKEEKKRKKKNEDDLHV